MPLAAPVVLPHAVKDERMEQPTAQPTIVSFLLDLELLSVSFGGQQSEAHEQAEQRTHMHHEGFQ